MLILWSNLTKHQAFSERYWKLSASNSFSFTLGGERGCTQQFAGL